MVSLTTQANSTCMHSVANFYWRSQLRYYYESKGCLLAWNWWDEGAHTIQRMPKKKLHNHYRCLGEECLSSHGLSINMDPFTRNAYNFHSTRLCFNSKIKVDFSIQNFISWKDKDASSPPIELSSSHFFFLLFWEPKQT